MEEREITLEVGQAIAIDDPLPTLRVTYAGVYSVQRILDTWVIKRVEGQREYDVPGAGQAGC